jgi:putative transposase
MGNRRPAGSCVGWAYSPTLFSLAKSRVVGKTLLMPKYTRAVQPGGTFFLTLVTERRAPIFAAERCRTLLHAALDRCRRHHPFTINAMVLLPDPLHLLLTLPENDADFSICVTGIKSAFTRAYLAGGGAEQARSRSRVRQRTRGVWLKRFWEHTIRDADDFRRHVEYIHYNPVKHGYARCPHAWPYSTFARFVAAKDYDADWCCQCHRAASPPCVESIARHAGE